jgi:hypothetical protein
VGIRAVGRLAAAVGGTLLCLLLVYAGGSRLLGRRANPTPGVATSLERQAVYAFAAFQDELCIAEISRKAALKPGGELNSFNWAAPARYALAALPAELSGANQLALDGGFRVMPAPDFQLGSAQVLGQASAVRWCSSAQLPSLVLRISGGRLTGCLRASSASRSPAPPGKPPQPVWSELQLQAALAVRQIDPAWHLGGAGPTLHLLEGREPWYLVEIDEGLLPAAQRTPAPLYAAGYRHYLLCDRRAIEQALR